MLNVVVSPEHRYKVNLSAEQVSVKASSWGLTWINEHHLTTSSILRMLRTVSVAKVSALIETSKGWTTSSSMMLEIPPYYTLKNKGLDHAKLAVAEAFLERSSTHLAHVNAGHLVSLSVPVAEFSHGGNGVQACVFGQR